MNNIPLTEKEEKLISFYNKADTQCAPCNNMPNLAATLEKHGVQFKGDIMDAGCGHGRFGRYVALLDAVDSVLGVDYSPRRVKTANDLNKSQKATFEQGSLYSFETDRKFDLVACFETLEHLDRPMDAVANLRVMLKPNGVMVGSCPLNHVFRSRIQVWPTASDFLEAIPGAEILLREKDGHTYVIWRVKPDGH